MTLQRKGGNQEYQQTFITMMSLYHSKSDSKENFISKNFLVSTQVKSKEVKRFGDSSLRIAY